MLIRKFKNGNELTLCGGSFNMKRLCKLFDDLSDFWLDFIDKFKQYPKETGKFMN